MLERVGFLNIVDESYSKLFGKECEYHTELKFSGKFRGYNANIRKTRYGIVVSASKQWRSIDKEILIGLIQHLMVRIFKAKAKTTNMDLYNSFIKNLHISVGKTRQDAFLKIIFNKINNDYFMGMMEAPNLEWSSGTRVVGTYEYATDTIKVSSFLQEDIQLMEYVIYHEMLHKKYKFKSSGMKTIHHPKAFRDEEKRFKNSAELEKRLYRLCAAKRISLF